ncbi:hypothetical protein CHLRE_04g213050v5 [Chlamydomonas reinhardtii]|uniref:Uncharacterized protein n=1 Tax=Chlamydomonas reinhardtii TaxID=3055 RepID=A0A2K3DTX5_CHLRE|nr:uncharacterized protein CHLRE_04g213050v5 [Chlamydomonas reinhardtii]PNW83983.1 hypothetical protein CHLRE_04g213050v5 [Chlamydomonas reinhardtii]
MADKKRAELAALVEDACEGLAECGFLGIMETPVMRVFSDLHKLNDTTNLSKFLAAFEDAATRTISAKKPASFPELMVLSQLLQDVEGPAAPPEGDDSPVAAEFKSLSSNLRLALLVALQGFARPGSDEAKQGVAMAGGMLQMLHDKVAADPLATLAVEHALLRLLARSKDLVVLLRDRTWALAALNKQVEALKDHKPESLEEGVAEEGGADGEEEDAEEEEVDGEEEEVEVEEEEGDEDGEEDEE